MELFEAKDIFDTALSRKECMTLFCNCEVIYSGRAEAFLRRGDRMIVIKSDGTLLVHQPDGSTPVNYMKQDCMIELINHEDHLLLRTRNLDLKEYLDIEIFRTYTIAHHKMEDGQKLELAGNERDMSDMIRDNPSMISADFTPLSREEHTKFGFIDVFGHDKKGNMVIVECKRYTGSLQCVTQLRRYVEKISELKGLEMKKVKGILASPSISPNALEMLQKWGFEWRQINPPKKLERSKNQTVLGQW